MSTTFPAEERIFSYETLNLIGVTDNTAIYSAPDDDFTVTTVTIKRENLIHSGHPVPERIVIATSWDGLK